MGKRNKLITETEEGVDWSISENCNSQEETIKMRTSKEEEPTKRGRVIWCDITLILFFSKERIKGKIRSKRRLL